MLLCNHMEENKSYHIIGVALQVYKDCNNLLILKHTCFKHTSVTKDGTGTLTKIIYVHIENCRDLSLKFKPEQYNNLLNVMQHYFQPHITVVYHCSRQSALVLLMIETEHLSANSTVQDTPKQSRSPPLHRVTTGSLCKSF